jgi:predicted TIM-barrel fold metal-dependent hydrolase
VGPVTRPFVVDADGHVFEPPRLWLDRMDPKWGDWIPARETTSDWYETHRVGGEIRAGGREVTDSICAAVGMTPREFYDLLESLRRPGGSDPDARLVDMDADGIDAAVLYPSNALFAGPLDPIEAFRNVDFVAAFQRAYNEWIGEYCAAHPERLFAIGAVPLQDPERAIVEAEHAVNRLGCRGIFLRPSAYVGELPLNHGVYDRFWAACQDLDVPVALHPGVHVDTPGACRKFGLIAESANMSITNMAQSELYGGSALGQAVGNAVDMIVSLGRLLMGGVCARFPKLRFLCLEAGGGWVPTILERMDEQVKAFPLERRWLDLLPSEYFRRQCWVGFEAEEWNLAASAEFLGADRILWASDYPHPEYRPGLVEELLEKVGPLPEASRRRILSDNAIEAYRLPISPVR